MRVAHVLRVQPAQHGRKHRLPIKDDHLPKHEKSNLRWTTSRGAAGLRDPQYDDPSRDARRSKSGSSPLGGRGSVPSSEPGNQSPGRRPRPTRAVDDPRLKWSQPGSNRRPLACKATSQEARSGEPRLVSRFLLPGSPPFPPFPPPFAASRDTFGTQFQRCLLSPLACA